MLCSVNKAGLKTETWLLYCAKHSTSNWGERERAPSCGLDGRAVTIYRYIYIYNIIIIIYIAHTNIGTDTERKKSKGKRANHMIQF